MDGVEVSRIAFYGDSGRSKRSEQERVCPKTEEMKCAATTRVNN
jgi:hypothetical protein